MNSLNILKSNLRGELYHDDLMRALYATDASVYRELPIAVAYPKDVFDLKLLIAFANDNNVSLIPRTAGTSLAGQCVGEGIVVDVSKYFTKIISVDTTTKTVTLQPGVVRDELNNYLKPYGLFFGPNTSTSNRCMIGGMVGNNSSGSTSIQYGVTRDKVLKLEVLLSDGSEVEFKSISNQEFRGKLELQTLEGIIYKSIFDTLVKPEVKNEIEKEFPKPTIHRRNTGYALDSLIDSQIFNENSLNQFNMCELLCGSEGTLAFTTQITLQLDNLPPTYSCLVAAHYNTIPDCMQAVVPAMKHNLYMCEMMDKTILDLTKHNKTQQDNRSFIEGDPEAILMCELRSNSADESISKAIALRDELLASGLGYAYPILQDDEIDKAVELRKAGLGLLGNIIGDKKTVACIEDTAVALPDLANYIEDFTKLMEKFDQKAVYYAHAGAGELHLRPILNLKKSEDVSLFREITTQVAHLVKSYNGSMSGEHGDGRVRSEFIPLMVGKANYEIVKYIKSVFDPKNIFNPGKIVAAKPMDSFLRYEADRKEPEIDTILDFSSSQGILREAEKCNGTGDCRKLPEFGGVMCPSYRATRNEKDTTRARANALREFLTHSDKVNRFDHDELKTVFDLCLSCKACSTECPSSVDVASLKAEFQYQYQQANGIPVRTKLFAYNNTINRIASSSAGISNFMFSNKVISSMIKSTLRVAKERSLPLVSGKSLRSKATHLLKNNPTSPLKKVWFFVDEFTNYLDTQIGEEAILLLQALGYQVRLLDHEESGRSFISKGLLKEAKKLANKNIAIFKALIGEETPLVGLEPSAILTFKDEYLRLCDDKGAAKEISNNTFLIDDFLAIEIDAGRIKADSFTDEGKILKFHGHCHQKALSSQSSSFKILNLPKNYKATIIPSGCCGMAGSFGYEKEHYNVSMTIGEQTLFPAIRKTNKEVEIVANGTSCRHQIKDGTGRLAKHTVTILFEALKQK